MVRALLADRRGGISMMAIFLIIALIGCSALAVEYGRGLLSMSQDQRVADLAAFSAASVYANNGDNTTNMTAAANNVAALNGLSSDATASIVTSPANSSHSAVKVVIKTTDPLDLAHVLTGSANLPVTAVSYADINPASTPGCIVALSNTGTGVTVQSSSNITATKCAVASNAAVTANNSSTITTPVVDFGTTHSATNSSSISPPAGTSAVQFNPETTSDPLAGNAGVSAAYAHLGYNSSGTCSDTSSADTSGVVCDIHSPTVASGGANVSFSSGSQSGTLPAGCTATASGSTFTINCTGSGPFKFGALTVSNSTNLNFNTKSGVTYIFTGGISVSSSASATFGAGTYQVGNAGSPPACGSSGDSICDSSSSSISFAGPDTFVTSGGIATGNSSSITMGSGSSSNSYDIGADSSGNSLNVAGSTTLSLGDATASGGIFETAGSIVTQSSATLTLPAISAHDINGNLSIANSSTANLGAGVYTVTGYVSVGNSANFNATDVTLTIGGANTCAAGVVYCTSNSSNITLVAPTSGTTEDLAIIGPPPGSADLTGGWSSYKSPNPTAGADIANSSSGTLSGAVYFPDGTVNVSSSAGLGGGSTGCLELVGASVTATSSSGIASACSGLDGGASSTTQITLVQ